MDVMECDDGIYSDETIPVTDKQCQVTLLTEIKPSGNNGTMFGQSEIIIPGKDRSKKMVPRRMNSSQPW